MRGLPRTIPLAVLCAVLAGCGTAGTTSTSGFSGGKQEVAKVIADFQSAASSSEPGKICSEDLAATLVRRLGGSKVCETAIKRQLDQVDELELTVESVELEAGQKKARATVQGVYEGRKRPSTLSLVKEARGWRIAGLG